MTSNPVIVRLQERAKWLRSEYLNGGNFEHLSAREQECTYIAHDIVEPEIDRLTARVAELEAQSSKWFFERNDEIDRNVRLEAERDRLRAALEKIKKRIEFVPIALREQDEIVVLEIADEALAGAADETEGSR